jgi:hypothetical protein
MILCTHRDVHFRCSIPNILERFRHMREDPDAVFEKRLVPRCWVENCIQEGRLLEPTPDYSIRMRAPVPAIAEESRNTIEE